MDISKFINELEKSYDCLANIITLESREEDGLVYNDIEVVKYENIKCGISYKTFYPPIQTEVPKATMQIKIFLNTNIEVPVNSKILITDSKNRVRTYKSSSIAAIYDTHQEINLEEINTTGD